MSIPSVLFASMLITVDGPGDAMSVTVETNPAGAARWFDDGDVDIDVAILDGAGTVVGTSTCVAVPNRGDGHARYHRATFDLAALAPGLNLAAGAYTVEARPGASQWVQTNPDTGASRNRSMLDSSHLRCDIVLEAAGGLTTRQWRA